MKLGTFINIINENQYIEVVDTFGELLLGENTALYYKVWDYPTDLVNEDIVSIATYYTLDDGEVVEIVIDWEQKNE